MCCRNNILVPNVHSSPLLWLMISETSTSCHLGGSPLHRKTCFNLYLLLENKQSSHPVIPEVSSWLLNLPFSHWFWPASCLSLPLGYCDRDLLTTLLRGWPHCWWALSARTCSISCTFIPPPVITPANVIAKGIIFWDFFHQQASYNFSSSYFTSWEFSVHFRKFFSFLVPCNITTNPSRLFQNDTVFSTFSVM